MDELVRHRRDWNELAAFDPLWAVLTQRGKKGGRWELDEFLATGEREVATVLETVDAHHLPKERGRALDFGCGVGRLSRALGERFAEVTGVDISEVMIGRARELHADRPNVSFVLNEADDLAIFESGSFDFVCTSYVLQHLPERKSALGFVAEFIRLLRPGGVAVVQLPERLPWRARPMVRWRLYRLLRRVGLNPAFLIGTGRTNPMRMLAVSESDMRAWVESHGGRVVDVVLDAETPPPIRAVRYVIVPAADAQAG
jgi:2-polyprenyl-3-methyl-5-hydroxy-6-metoxy-1,4-benzoquinol methylase